MSAEADILAELEAEEDPGKLEAVVSGTEYTVPISDEDAALLTLDDKWEHLEGVLFRRKARRVQCDPDEKIIVFWVSPSECSLESCMKALQEELDDITGRKAEKDAGESWGMF